jgi:N-acetylated-alpha-linked acidic dipeptidase
MRRLALSAVVCAIVVLLAAAPAEEKPLFGFSTDSTRAQRDWESRFRSLPSPQNLRDYMQRLSARPHHTGSPYDKENAEWILARFQEWGWDAHIETFRVLFPTPKERLVEMIEPSKFVAKLQEPTVAEDPTSGQHGEQLSTYNAYSADGEVTAPLVYVNYGIPEDYERLERMGISVKGAIVIARYGASWRGIKPKVAAEHGAVGCLIYSDPRDDGYFAGDVFPQGPYRPKDGVQRGSVVDMPVYPGDPLTPGVGATAGAKRLELKDVKVFTTIPVLPLSYADAQPLLEALAGPVAPRKWRGALPLTYHVGPGPARVHLRVKSNWDLKPIHDVIARIPGSTAPQEWIVRGNHYDAWVNGAQDPISGMVAELEEARALGELLKQGWRPKRTIIYAAWDGEEPGLLGSTEWAEEHAAELRQHAVAYINTDSNSRGYLGMGGSHSLEHLINDVARDIPDPERQISVWKRARLRDIGNASNQQDREEIRRRADLRIGALGSGSDYTAFLDFLGIASLNLGYEGEAGGGIYHSIYDDFYWYTHFDDTDFVYGRALAQTAGTTVLRLADADLLPYDFTGVSDAVQRYVKQVQELLDHQREEATERNRELAEGVFTATADPHQTYVPPPKAEIPPYLNFAPLQNGSGALTRAAEHYQRALKKAEDNGGAALTQASLAAVNQKLLLTERALTSSDGLPNRPWFKHQLYAPGAYTGYGVKTLPAVREAIEQKRWDLADAQVVRVGRVLQDAAAAIDDAAAALEQAVK